MSNKEKSNLNSYTKFLYNLLEKGYFEIKKEKSNQKFKGKKWMKIFNNFKFIKDYFLKIVRSIQLKETQKNIINSTSAYNN